MDKIGTRHTESSLLAGESVVSYDRVLDICVGLPQISGVARAYYDLRHQETK